MEYGRWISAYKKHYKEIVPILILKEPRELSTRKNSKYFKFLSKENQLNNIKSNWYNNILKSLKLAKQNLENENIDKLTSLKVFIFSTSADGSLLKFTKIV